MQLGFDWATIIRQVFSPQGTFVFSLVVLAVGIVLGYLVWRSSRRFMRELGVPEAVEGTPFERTARGLGTSTVGIVSNLAALFIYITTVTAVLNIAQLTDPELYWARFTSFLPDLFIALFAVIIGLIAGDKAKLLVSERLRSVKMPEATVLPELVKYSIFYLAVLIALGQLGVETLALLILLGAYAFGLVFVCGLALKDILQAGAAGLYLLLTEPYSIGDEIVIGDQSGIVQEVDILVTRIESDGEEYIIPNKRVFNTGIVRIRS
ncbi:mechanosensitive ion channel family protein [Haloarcula sp. CBA1130]|uniref:mechanosensitive ion channel domain-containing protein n=1 Tax=unclassified Haloarcula TaxID=2624677 RepID=UPI00124748BC|nr:MULTISPECIES: mechanosensitive ion channel domain-containing protein [unclassified Haloarcula]KAA9397895.1 mechanosensitive ion channel family protein [Haloarcula sp. CBA1129]KAA9402416.1 mechanosensitive ion channel family protein [Haloarcula sp. CBA1130]